MSPGDWIALVGLLCVGAGAAVGYGALRQQVHDLKSDLDTQRADLIKAADDAKAVRELGASIEAMGEKFAAEVKHLGEIFGLKLGLMEERLGDLKAEVIRRHRVTATKTKAP